MQGRMEAPETNGRIYAYTKEDVQAVMIGQLHLANQDAYVLIDYGAMYSLTSSKFAKQLGRGSNRIRQPYRTTFPYVENFGV